MASSGSYARGDQPRSVPDPYGELHRLAAIKQRAYNERQEAELDEKAAAARQALPDKRGPAWAPDVGHPGALESIVPIWGSGREALADLHDGDYLGTVGNGVMAVSDLALIKGAAVAVGKGAVKVGGSYAWRSKPWEEVKGVRHWLGERGYLKPGEPGHHWAIPQNGWGKSIPDYVKNQPWNVKGLDAVTHGRIHGRYTVDGIKLPQFSGPERIWWR